MRAVIQRVTEASVSVEGEIVGEIGVGLLVLVGVGEADTAQDAEYIAAKTGGSTASISPETAREQLAEAGVGDDLARRTAEMLRGLRAGAYAPGASAALAPREAVADVRSLIDTLEGAVR